MSSFQPRYSIPDSWAQIGACPICDERALKVSRAPDKPDRMACGNCLVVFEMEVDGPHIRLQKLPPKYAENIQPAFQLWLTPHEIRHQIKETSIPKDQPPLIQQPNDAVYRLNSAIATNDTIGGSPFINELPAEPLTQEELTKRAVGLATLGNTPREIRETLSRFNATPEQINHAMEFIARQRRKKKSSVPRAIIYVLLVLIVCLGSASFVLPLIDIPKHIDTIAPIWAFLQKTFSGNDIYGGTGVTNSSPTKDLAEDELSYFKAIERINPSQSWWDQYESVRGLNVPYAVLGMHGQMLTEYRALAIFEAEIEMNRVHYNSLCTTQQELESTPCNRMDDSADALNNAYESQKEHLKKWWNITACPVYQDLLADRSSPWTWPDGSCGPY